MIRRNQNKGVAIFSNAFFYNLSLNFLGAVSRFPIQSFPANAAAKGFPLQSGLGFSIQHSTLLCQFEQSSRVVVYSSNFEKKC